MKAVPDIRKQSGLLYTHTHTHTHTHTLLINEPTVYTALYGSHLLTSPTLKRECRLHRSGLDFSVAVT
jgi:hypothetical protein